MIFNEGIEAAEVSREQAIAFLETAARNWSHISFDEDGLEDFRIELERFRQKAVTDGIKRPEPSEEERVEKVARALAKLRAVNDPDKTIKMNGLNKPWWRVFEEDARAALAALKAMEGE